MKSYSLQELNEHLKRVVALNVQDALWVRCEIAQLNESRGHYFMELVEKEETITAKASAILWMRSYNKLLREYGRGVQKVLNEGMEVMLKLKIEFHEVYGMQYYIEDIDTSFTLGKLALRKQEILEVFEKEGLLGKNTEVSLPFVLQKIAIISSENAAGYQDYLKQLEENVFGYKIDNQMFAAAMQGINVEEEILFQLKRIKRQKNKFDAVVIIRGGGAKLDLMAFDNEKISRVVANFPLPVLTGIGHDIDESILDRVAHTTLKTPTAVADFIINHNLFFENRLMKIGSELGLLAQEKIQEQIYIIQNFQQNLHWKSENLLKDTLQKISLIENEVMRTSKSYFQNEEKKISNLESIFEVLDPEKTLKRGFSLTSVDGKIIKSIKDLDGRRGIEITTQLSDGILKSKTK
ncbi:MAG: exodeoxyribonuclease VII large subunit [Saprospiraceae bacterium]|nr:exodeoxyribonuclease VII large subunit [Saprospiraceae bacterium]MDG2418261.1 exodeoxyribonuclease VII large subunit [Saprospiraceae bacterium]